MTSTSVIDYIINMNNWILRSLVVISVLIPILLCIFVHSVLLFLILSTPIFLLIISIIDLHNIVQTRHK